MSTGTLWDFFNSFKKYRKYSKKELEEFKSLPGFGVGALSDLVRGTLSLKIENKRKKATCLMLGNYSKNWH